MDLDHSVMVEETLKPYDLMTSWPGALDSFGYTDKYRKKCIHTYKSGFGALSLEPEAGA